MVYSLIQINFSSMCQIIRFWLIFNKHKLMSSLAFQQLLNPRKKIPLRSYKPIPKNVSPLKDSKQPQQPIKQQKTYYVNRKFSPQRKVKKNFNLWLSDTVLVFQKKKSKIIPKNKLIQELQSHKSEQKQKQSKILKQKNDDILVNKNKFRIQLKSKSNEKAIGNYFKNNPKQIRNIATSYNYRKKEVLTNIDAWQTQHQMFEMPEQMGLR